MNCTGNTSAYTEEQRVEFVMPSLYLMAQTGTSFTKPGTIFSESCCLPEPLRHWGNPVQLLPHFIFPGSHFWGLWRAQESLPRGALKTAGKVGKFLPLMSLRTTEGSTRSSGHCLQTIIQTTLPVCVYTRTGGDSRWQIHTLSHSRVAPVTA